MFRYYQTDEKGRWSAIPETPDVEEIVKGKGGRKLSILSVSELVDEDVDNDTLSHQGPLYFDIDYKEDLNEAIRGAKDLVNTLMNRYEVPKDVIWVYASGSKGMHIVIPATVFSSGRAMKGLPRVYMEMAAVMGVPGMDFQVYCGGKGNCFRIQNVQRADGNFRVPLTVDELLILDREKYLELVKAPRYLNRAPYEGVKAHALEALFETAKRRAKERQKKAELIPVANLAVISETAPACVTMACSGKVQQAKNYNQVAMQLAIWAARAAVAEDTYKSLFNQFADNSTSSQYAHRKERYNHILSLVRYIEKDNRKGFSCGAMRSITASYPCEGCPLEKGTKEELSIESLAADYGIHQDSDGYFIPSKDDKRARRISNFTLRGHSQIMEYPEDGRPPLRVGLLADVVSTTGEILNHVVIEEASFDSRASFMGVMRGVGECSFLGSETDAQKVKAMVLSGSQEMGEMRRVYSFGIHFDSTGGATKMRTYVEPGWSVNQLSVEGTHLLSGRYMGAPSMARVPSLGKGDAEAENALRAAFRLNKASKIGIIIGWLVASHLRQHFHQQFAQFPVAAVWGSAGSGKTTLLTSLAGFSGQSYGDEDGLLNVALVKKPFILDEFVSSSKTVPRLLDEYNKSKMAPEMYGYVGELLKAAFNLQATGRGTLSRNSNVNGRSRSGAEAVNYYISAPLIALSEQPPEIPAVVQRAVIVHLSAAERLAVQGEKHLRALRANQDGLQRVGKALMLAALHTRPEALEGLMDESYKHVPDEMPERSRFSYAAVLSGLVFLYQLCKAKELDVLEDITMLHDAVVEELRVSGTKLSQAKHRTEVDNVLEKVLEMIELTQAEMLMALKPGLHWAVEEEEGRRLLYLDMPIVHTLYKRYVRDQRGVPLDSLSVFCTLLMEESYFVANDCRPPGMMHQVQRPVWALDLQKMVDKGMHAARSLL